MCLNGLKNLDGWNSWSQSIKATNWAPITLREGVTPQSSYSKGPKHAVPTPHTSVQSQILNKNIFWLLFFLHILASKCTPKNWWGWSVRCIFWSKTAQNNNYCGLWNDIYYCAFKWWCPNRPNCTHKAFHWQSTGFLHLYLSFSYAKRVFTNSSKYRIRVFTCKHL